MKNARSIYSFKVIPFCSAFKYLWILLFIGFTSCGNHKGEFSRGVGIYPGDANDHFGPTLKVNTRIYKNLALNRASWHSSSYDYNLTAQLITDGIIDTFHKGSYNMVVVGRKRMSKAEEFVLGDPSVKLVRELSGTAIVVVKGR